MTYYCNRTSVPIRTHFPNKSLKIPVDYMNSTETYNIFGFSARGAGTSPTVWRDSAAQRSTIGISKNKTKTRNNTEEKRLRSTLNFPGLCTHLLMLFLYPKIINNNNKGFENRIGNVHMCAMCGVSVR